VFDVLRTKEQLGYHVCSSVRDTFGIVGFSVTVNCQAEKHRYIHIYRNDMHTETNFDFSTPMYSYILCCNLHHVISCHVMPCHALSLNTVAYVINALPGNSSVNTCTQR
jgi:hypothetical protein